MNSDFESFVIQAGEKALSKFHQSFFVYAKQDGSMVSEVDIEVESFLRASITSQFPGHEILGEESGRSGGSLNSSYLWLLDPIDGTESFCNLTPTWAVSVACYRKIANDYDPVATWICLPAIHSVLSFYSGHSSICQKSMDTQSQLLFNRQPLQAKRPSSSVIYTHSGYHHELDFIKGWKIRSLGSVCYHVALLILGFGKAVFANQVKIWDIAAAIPMLATCGFEIYHWNGKSIPLSFSEWQDGNCDFFICHKSEKEEVLKHFQIASVKTATPDKNKSQTIG